MPKTITLEDAGLLQMACHLGGMAHPPGYPLFIILCKPLVQLPLPPVIAGNLVSIIFATVTALLLFEISRYYFKQTAYGLIFTLGYSFSLAFWSQAIIIEVYTLNTMMFAICWVLALKLRTTLNLRYFYGLTFCFSLALCNHWPLMVLSIPALVILLIPVLPLLMDQIKSIQFWLISTALLLLGLTPYLILFQQNPEIALYGGIESLREFILYVTRAYYYYDDQSLTAEFMDKFRYIGWLVTESAIQFGYVGTPLLVVGAVYCLKRFDTYTNLSLIFLLSGSIIVLPLLLNFDFADKWQGIVKPYPLLSYMAAAFWMTCGFAYISEKVSVKVSWFTSTASGFLILMILLSNYNFNNRNEDFVADTFGRTVLSTLDQNASVFVTGDVGTGVLGYFHHVEGRRPDIQLYHVYGQLFSNRLGSPVSDTKDRFAKINLDYMLNSENSVYSLNSVFSPNPSISPSIDYGILAKFNPQGSGIGYLPEVEKYFDFILMADNKHWITAPHEKSLVSHQIYLLAHHYLKYTSSLSAPTDDQTAGIKSRIKSIEKTFHGKLAMMVAATEKKLIQKSKADLMRLAMEVEAAIPDGLRAHFLGLVYQATGEIHLLDEPDFPRDVNKAISYFEQSVKENPHPRNRSICLLHDLYLETDGHSAENFLSKKGINTGFCKK